MAILFLAFGALLVGFSLLVILHRNPVTSALFLVLAFCSLAGIYLLLQAEFLAMVQVIVYAGAIMVLFLFVIMYLNLKRDEEDGAPHVLRRFVGWAIGALLLVEGAVYFGKRWAIGATVQEPSMGGGNTVEIGRLLYSRYLFPFEITSVLLIVAILGAVLIGRGRTAPVPPSEEVRP